MAEREVLFLSVKCHMIDILEMASEKDICEKRVMEICSSDHKDPLAIRRVIDLSHSL